MNKKIFIIPIFVILGLVAFTGYTTHAAQMKGGFENLTDEQKTMFESQTGAETAPNVGAML